MRSKLVVLSIELVFLYHFGPTFDRVPVEWGCQSVYPRVAGNKYYTMSAREKKKSLISQ